MNTWSNNLRTMMARNSDLAQRKDLILELPKRKRRRMKKKRPSLNHFVNSSRMSLETKLKKSLLELELMNRHVYL